VYLFLVAFAQNIAFFMIWFLFPESIWFTRRELKRARDSELDIEKVRKYIEEAVKNLMLTACARNPTGAATLSENQ
jgi:hypothetical protein